MPLNIPYYEMDIPRLVTAAADWLACLLYLRFLPPRCGGARRAVLYTGAFAVLVVYLVATDGFDGWRFNVLYAVSVALMLLFMTAATRADWCQVVFFCTRAFILAGFAASLTWQMYVYFAKDNPLLQGLPALVLFIAAGFGLIFGLMWLVEDGGNIGSVQLDIRPRTAAIAAGLAAAVYILSSISYTTLKTPFSARGTMEIYTMRSVVYFGGVALLLAYQSQLCDLSTQREADALRNMLHLQYENYKAKQESVDLINQKYHDLKHQIAVLRSESGEERNAVLDRMEQEIKAYEAQNDTGNKVLDTVLTGKSLTCRAQNIQLTVVADGAALDFMDVMDISNLFGNALDNAIRAAKDSQRKVVDIHIQPQGAYSSIVIANDIAHPVLSDNPALRTTKNIRYRHGFGIQNMRQAVERNQGLIRFYEQNDRFICDILLLNAHSRNE
mgnify:CR=1 FL=1